MTIKTTPNVLTPSNTALPHQGSSLSKKQKEEEEENYKVKED
jgi:hypothetical protein